MIIGTRSIFVPTKEGRTGYQRDSETHQRTHRYVLYTIRLSTKTHSSIGVKESDTGLAPPNLWDIPADKQRMSEEHPLQVARCTKIIRVDPVKAAAAAAVNPAGAMQGQKGADEQDQYVINIKQIAKFVVGLGERVAPTDVEEGMRVGCVAIISHTAISILTSLV